MRKRYSGRTAQEALQNRHNKIPSWKEISRELNGINPGFLCAIAHGKKNAPPSVLKALCMPVIVSVKQEICKRCGRLHRVAGRCRKKTFEENAIAYDVWLKKNVERLQKTVSWAERKR